MPKQIWPRFSKVIHNTRKNILFPFLCDSLILTDFWLISDIVESNVVGISQQISAVFHYWVNNWPVYLDIWHFYYIKGLIRNQTERIWRFSEDSCFCVKEWNCAGSFGRCVLRWFSMTYFRFLHGGLNKRAEFPVKRILFNTVSCVLSLTVLLHV